MLRKISDGREESHETEAEGGTVTEKQLHSWRWTEEGAVSQGKPATIWTRQEMDSPLQLPWPC